ncbi:MAG: aquaporin Z [Dermatophilaceae bacterium]|nr:aquaporin Z [Dermatophilaceae bacterium]MBP9918965.1 aquaporin Z [Dermatophilaceae bacterium]
MTPPLSKRIGAELLGTFWLVFGGCGSAIFAAKYFAAGGALDANGTELGIGFLGVSLAFGLTVVTMAYAVGHVSGGHFNPAVTLGLWAAKRFDNGRDVVAYIGAQVVGGLLAGACLWGLAKSAKGSGSMVGNMAANGYGDHSPGGYSMWAVFLAEALLTAFFLFIILGVTTGHAPVGFAPLAIGLALALIHLISIPISNTSVNPARSTAVAFFNGNGAPGQLWLFWLAPIVGAVIAGFTYEAITGIDGSHKDVSGDETVAARP